VNILTDQAKYDAVLQNDESFDGTFVYGVETTKVFCRPSCKSRIPKRKNVRFFDDAEQAAKSGFRPCKRCRPDLLIYQPGREAAEKIKQLIERFFKEKSDLSAELLSLGFSAHRIAEIYKEEYGQTPVQYADSLRIDEAKRLLETSDDDIVDIAFASGFGSVASFYRAFKKNTGYSPAKYRSNNGGE